MKLRKLTFAFAAVAISFNAAAGQGLRQPASVPLASLDYYAQEDGADHVSSPSDVVAAPSDCGCESSCGCDPCQPWRLFGQDACGHTIGGWLEAGYTLNGYGVESVNGNFPVEFNNMSDGAVVNQMWFFAEKVASTCGCGWDWGYRVDYVFGTDAANTQAYGDQGWDFGWNSSRDYGSAIPQIYGEIALNDVSIKLGHFYTIIGHEVVPAPDNFFYTHSYALAYGEPITHTGLLATYDYSDNLTLYGGWVMGADSGFDNFNSASTFLGGSRYAFTDDATLTWALMAGDFGNGFSGVPFSEDVDVYMSSLVLEYCLTDRLTYVFQHDLGIVSNIDTVPGVDQVEWYGLNQYLIYDINDCWAAGLRMEWFRDDDNVLGLTDEGHYYEATLGLNWRPRANLAVRPEIRWDWHDSPTGVRVYNGATRNSLATFSTDVIFTY